jgi:hypothetical protein
LAGRLRHPVQAGTPQPHAIDAISETEDDLEAMILVEECAELLHEMSPAQSNPIFNPYLFWQPMQKSGIAKSWHDRETVRSRYRPNFQCEVSPGHSPRANSPQIAVQRERLDWMLSPIPIPMSKPANGDRKQLQTHVSDHLSSRI